jgi:hypothetical protein
MQKAMVVRATATNSAQGAARSWSQPVDGAAGDDRPLAALLSAGWRIANAFPMPGDLESSCLVVLENPASATDAPLAALAEPALPPAANRSRAWDGETIPLGIFGLTG